MRRMVFSWLLATGCWLLLLLTSASAGPEPTRLGLGSIGILPFLRVRLTLERFPDILTLPDREESRSRAIPVIISVALPAIARWPRGRRPNHPCEPTSPSFLRASAIALRSNRSPGRAWSADNDRSANCGSASPAIL